jgi:predicted ATP-dependent protease
VATRRALVGSRRGRLPTHLQSLVQVVSHIDSISEENEKNMVKIREQDELIQQLVSTVSPIRLVALATGTKLYQPFLTVW